MHINIQYVRTTILYFPILSCQPSQRNLVMCPVTLVEDKNANVCDCNYTVTSNYIMLCLLVIIYHDCNYTLIPGM